MPGSFHETCLYVLNMKKGGYGGEGTFMHFSAILSGRSKQIVFHFQADTYDIKPTR